MLRIVVPIAAIVVAIGLVACGPTMQYGAPGAPPWEARDFREPQDAVVIESGTDVLATVASHPPGTAFVFASGIHRIEDAIVARDGDVYFGRQGAVLNGAQPLEGFTFDGVYWSRPVSVEPGGKGECRAEAPRCTWRQDLYINGRALAHVASIADVEPGTWSYQDGRAYLAEDPRTARVELGVADGAIVGDASGVTIQGLTIEMFANEAQRGAIHAERVAESTYVGQEWLIHGNTIRWVHGVGIRAGGGSWITENRVLHAGQLGIASYGPGSSSGPTVFEANEVAFSNEAGYLEGWEAGGSKFALTDGLVLRDNHVHHNRGPGLWSDVGAIGTLYEGNLVEHNTHTGIFHEISYDALIRNNVVRYNGLVHGRDSGTYVHVYGAGILVANSRNVEVTGNEVIGNWNGIAGIHQDRGSGRYGHYELRNLYVHGNEVGVLFHEDGIGPQGERGVHGISGVTQPGPFDAVFSEAWSNRFEGNTYRLAEVDGYHFNWRDEPRRFGDWRVCGGDDTLYDECRQDPDGEVLEVDPSTLTPP